MRDESVELTTASSFEDFYSQLQAVEEKRMGADGKEEGEEGGEKKPEGKLAKLEPDFK